MSENHEGKFDIDRKLEENKMLLYEKFVTKI